MPPWSPVTATVDVVCRLHQRINDVYDVSQIDVVVVGIFHQVTHRICAFSRPSASLQQGIQGRCRRSPQQFRHGPVPHW